MSVKNVFNAVRLGSALDEHGASVFYKKDGLTFRQQALKQGMPDVAAFARRIEKDRAATISAMSMGCRM